MTEEPILRLKDVQMYFPVSKGFSKTDLRAVDGVSLAIKKGETMGLVGESGCGKSTLGRVVVGLYRNTDGEIFFHEKELRTLKGEEQKAYRKNVQMIFQDPYASLNPRMKVGQIVGEPLLFHSDLKRQEIRSLVEETLVTVGLSAAAYDRYPHEFSGGQQQRIGIARAIISRPEFIVCDEAVSALDVSVQAQVLNLLNDLKEKYDLTYLFISHNLSVIKHICDRVAVMYLGQIVELGSREQVFEHPLHPYTKALLSSIPVAEGERKQKRIVLEGDLPSPIDPPAGCRFHNRCYCAAEECSLALPCLREAEQGHFVRCIKSVTD